MPSARRPVQAALARTAVLSVLAGAAGLLGGCAVFAPDDEPAATPRKEMVYAVTDGAELIQFNAGAPQKILSRKPLKGLPADDWIAGIDFRVSRGVLFALTAGGRLYTLDTATGTLQPVGSLPPVLLKGGAIGMNFNPVADRIRVVTDSGQNLRLHPETGAVAATDPPLAYAPGDPRHGQAPQVSAAAYTYNKKDDKLTTNYAIDRVAGLLVTQGTVEGTVPAVSPNTGQLRSVGPLGTGPVTAASLDISDTDNTALAALRQNGKTRLHLVNLATGKATVLGTVGDGRPLWGIAIEP